MESNNYTWFMTSTVEAMLPRFSDRNIVLTMKIDADWTDHGYGEDGNTKVREESSFRKTFFLVFHRPSNYTKVLMAEIPQDVKERHYRLLPCTGTYKIKQYSDHDSCWRSDGFNWVFQSFCEAWDFFEEKGVEGRKIDPSWHYSIWSGEPQYWLVDKLELADPNDRWGSDYNITFNRKIGLDEISKFMVDTVYKGD